MNIATFVRPLGCHMSASRPKGAQPLGPSQEKQFPCRKMSHLLTITITNGKIMQNIIKKLSLLRPFYSCRHWLLSQCRRASLRLRMYVNFLEISYEDNSPTQLPVGQQFGNSEVYRLRNTYVDLQIEASCWSREILFHLLQHS